MGKKKLETHLVDDGKKQELHLSKRLEGLFKKAKETSSLTSLMVLLREKEKRKRERNNTTTTTKDTVQCLEIINLEESNAAKEPNPLKSTLLEKNRETMMMLKDNSTSTVLGLDNDQCVDKPVSFNFGWDYSTVEDFPDLENDFSFASVKFGSVFDHDHDHDLVIEEGAGLHVSNGELKYSTRDVLKLSSQDDMIMEFLKENLIDSS